MTFRQIHPSDHSIPVTDLLGAYAPDPQVVAAAAQQGAPWIRVNMVASVDGAMSLEGRSGGLSSPADKAVFRVLRTLADVVVVGAGTARTEGYGPVRLDEDLMDYRRSEGRPALPRLAVVTNSGSLPADQPFSDPQRRTPDDEPVLVLTSARGAEVLSHSGDHLEVVVTGNDEVDLVAAMAHLATLGHVVVSEGGPALNTSMLRRGLLNELCLTIAPLITSGAAGRIVAPGLDEPVATELTHVFESAGSLFTRWAVKPHS